jgi:hypothetical protein
MIDGLEQQPPTAWLRNGPARTSAWRQPVHFEVGPPPERWLNGTFEPEGDAGHEKRAESIETRAGSLTTTWSRPCGRRIAFSSVR